MKPLGTASKLARLAALLVAFMLAAACNSKPAPESAAKAKKPKPAASASASKQAAAPEDPTAKMARGIGNGKPGAAVDIKYDILARPETGKPVEVEIALLPNIGVESMEAVFGGMDGITLAGNLNASFPEVKAGEVYKHTLSLLPDRDGVYYISVTVTAHMGGTSLSRAFSLPFIVGKAPTEQKAAKPTVDSTGQAVESMPAEEPKH